MILGTHPIMDFKIERRTPTVASRLFSLFGVVGLLAAVVAGATIWLVLTDPVTVAESMDSGEVTPLVQSLAGSIYEALVKLLKYL
jgi:Na+/proline symporter